MGLFRILPGGAYVEWPQEEAKYKKKEKKHFLLGGAYVEWSLLLEEANRKKRKERKFLPGAYVEWPLEEAKCEGQLFGRGLQPGRYV